MWKEKYQKALINKLYTRYTENTSDNLMIKIEVYYAKRKQNQMRGNKIERKLFQILPQVI